jgi:hypothetical protein
VHSRRAVPTQRSAIAFACGACGGVRTTSMPAPVTQAVVGCFVVPRMSQDEELHVLRGVPRTRSNISPRVLRVRA